MMYRVMWEIDIEAETPREAAVKAFAAMQREGTTANAFDVQWLGGTPLRVDLSDETDEWGD